MVRPQHDLVKLYVLQVPFYSCAYSSDSNSIKVFVRVRPLTSGTGLTTDGDQNLCLTVSSPNTIRLHSKPEPRTFTYDHVADVDTSQVESTWLLFFMKLHLALITLA